MTTPRTWNMFAHRYEYPDKPSALWNLGERKWVELHGLDHPIVPVRITEWLGDPRAPEVTHYGWEYSAEYVERYAKKPDHVTMIYPRVAAAHLTPWFFLHMCMPYGLQTEIDRGLGKMVALTVVETV